MTAVEMYQAGRCADCRHHRGAENCRGCQWERSTDDYVAPMVGSADREYLTRIEAERVTLEFRSRSVRRIDAGRVPFEESPLFDGPAQGGLFS